MFREKNLLKNIKRLLKSHELDQDGALVLNDFGKTIKIYFDVYNHNDYIIEEISKSDDNTFYILYGRDIEVGYHLLYIISNLLISKGELRKVCITGSDEYINYWGYILEEAKVYHTCLRL